LEISIRKVTINDALQIAIIYNYYVQNSVVTFDKLPFTKEDFEARIKAISSKFPFIVFEENNEVLGYAYADTWRTKPAYQHTAECTLYVKHNAFGKKIGSQLYSKLLDLLKAQGIKVVIGGLSLPNPESIGLHKKFGFRKVAHFEKVGEKFGKLIDVCFWQLDL
jgi:L-amino acid N-acyltransferase YncA